MERLTEDKLEERFTIHHKERCENKEYTEHIYKRLYEYYKWKKRYMGAKPEFFRSKSY